MAKIIKLQDKNGNVVYPVVHAKGVYMSDGTSIEDKISNNGGNTENLVTKDEIANYLTKKEASTKYLAIDGNATTADYATEAGNALSATKATQDNLGNKITTTYATKSELSSKQDSLISGSNIKTINGNSILGEGDITIEGGSSDANVQAVDTQETIDSVDGFKTINGQSILGSGNIDIGGSSSGGAYAEVNHSTSDTTFALTPNTFHVWDEVASLDLSLSDEIAGVANEYIFQFTSGATTTALILPDSVKWVNDVTPTIAENMIYQISIVNGLAVCLEFSNTVALIENKATVTDTSNGEVQFQYPVASTIIVNVRSDMNYELTFNEGDQTKSVDELSIDGYIITSINPIKDSVYNYTF